MTSDKDNNTSIVSRAVNSESKDSKDSNYELSVNPQLSTILSLNDEVNHMDIKDMDEAYKFLDAETEELVLDPVYEKKLVRKIDFHIMTIICGLMAVQMMDKTTNSYAALMGLRTDLKMTAKEYEWVGSSFYLGYLVFEYPANLILQKCPLSKTLGVAIILWGIVLMCHAAAKCAATFLLCRTILGIFEGFMNPSYIIMTSQWYRKEEQFMRTCLWYGFQGLGTLVGAAIAYGLQVHRTGYQSFASWKCFYIITGAITIFLGFVSIFHVPDVPVKAWFLNKKDKMYAIERSKANQQGFGNRKFKKYQLIEAFSDPVIYFIFIYAMSYAIPNGGLNNFGSILLNEDFGFSAQQSSLMNMPGGGLDIIFPPAVALMNHFWLKDFKLISMVIVNLLCIVGTCLLAFTDHRGSKLTGYYTLYISTTNMAGVASLVSSNVAGHTKKITASTVFLVGYCVGNMIGPQTFRESQAPGYAGAKTAMLVSYCAGAAALLGIYFIYLKRNRSRAAEREQAEEIITTDKLAFADLTDLQNPEFIYDL